ncbi:hypothetical protein GE107_19960 [Cohnella sp. CFH 77786]|uniref:GyrI-like domain-containing protein n=1 Tax=Cohnella sp. CFH 77786 TaxID=2662265 RepID=UPI001C6087A0|nr:GyrI-like domain-containing protein [Cohnella sp. CFH 77786]MBW5448322.1 hypothetical protein [Cohnella sp. CFH 77786]
MVNATGIIQTRVVWKNDFQVVGERIHFDPSADVPPSQNEIARLWPRFSDRAGEIEHVAGGAYGLCLFGPDCEPGGPFDYMAAVGVSRAERVPEGMTAAKFPGGLYCVVTRQGVIDEIGQAFRHFREEWLPQSGYKSRSGVEFEYYDERYKGNHDPESVMDIWFPIEPAKPVPLENRVGSVFVHVSDLRKSAEWYSRLLGVPVREDRLNGSPVYWFAFPGAHLILDDNSGNRQNPAWREDMKPRVMFPARDIDEAYRYLREKAEPLLEPERYGDMAFCEFRDPEGNVQMACWVAAPDPDDDLPAGSPILPRIGGAFVDVKDMRAAARWYTDLLGLPADEENAAHPIYSVPVTRGAALLLDQNRHLNGKAFSKVFYFETEDLAAALDYVKRHGFELAGEPDGFPDLSEFALLDPDGNRIVIAHMKR